MNEKNVELEEFYDDEPIIVEIDYVNGKTLKELKTNVNKKIDQGWSPIEQNPFFVEGEGWYQTIVYEMTEEELEEEENKKK